MSYRSINHGSFGVHSINKVTLLETVSTGLFVVDYREKGPTHRRRRFSLETRDLDEAKKKISDIMQQIKKRGHPTQRRCETVLYVLQRGENGPIKVGVSRQLKNRLDDLQTGNAEKLRVLRAYTMKDVERAIHAELERVARLEGEWFPMDLLSFVDRFFNVSQGVELRRAQTRALNSQIVSLMTQKKRHQNEGLKMPATARLPEGSETK